MATGGTGNNNKTIDNNDWTLTKSVGSKMDDGWYDNGDVERSETVMSYHLRSGRFFYDAIPVC